MRKQLLALLSALGLAGSSTPASPQVLKGAKTQPDTKSESTVKRSKKAQEDAASKDAAKMTKAANEKNAAAKSAEDKRKIGKAEANSAAGDKVHKEKVQSVEGGHATSDVVTEKGRKAGGDPQLQDAHIKKAVKGKAETNAVQSTRHDKWRKSTAELKAGEQDANQKALKQTEKASPK
jgi:hypothetical protein